MIILLQTSDSVGEHRNHKLVLYVYGSETQLEVGGNLTLKALNLFAKNIAPIFFFSI